MANAEVLASLKHDGVTYRPGDTLEADQAIIDQLEAADVVKVLKETPKAAPKAPESNQKPKTGSKAK